MRDAPGQHPRARSGDVEESGLAAEPLRRLTSELFQAAPGRFGVVLQEMPPGFLRGQLGKAGVDAEHPDHPGVLGHALVDHLLARCPRSRLGTEGQVLVGEMRPDAQRLESLGGVSVHQECVGVHATSSERAGER
jgi:hypothetical protein